MKPFSVFLFFSFWCHFSVAQTPDTAPWCPPGATWVYDMFSQSDNRFLQLSYVKDTVIQGKTAKQLQALNIKYYGPQNQVRIVDSLGKEYYYNSNDSVFVYDAGQFKFIYSFNPVPGDKWVVENSRATCSNSGFA